MTETYIPVRACTFIPINGLLVTHNGYTLESTINMILVIDGITLVANDWVLLAGQADTTQNGLFRLQQQGIAIGPSARHWILARDKLGMSLYHNMVFRILEGIQNINRTLILTVRDPITAGYTQIPSANIITVPDAEANIPGYAVDISADNGQIALSNGATVLGSMIDAEILSNDDGAIFTWDVPTHLKANILADDNGVVLVHGLSSTQSTATFKGDYYDRFGTYVSLVHGTAQSTANYAGNIFTYGDYSMANNGTYLAMLSIGACVEFGDPIFHKSYIKIFGPIGNIPPAGGPLAFSLPFYSFDAGSTYIIKSCFLNMSFQTNPAILLAETPDTGIGTTNVTGEAQALLSTCSAGAENVVTGQTAPDTNNTQFEVIITNQVLGILEATNANRTLHLSLAFNWTPSAGCTLLCDGYVFVEWYRVI